MAKSVIKTSKLAESFVNNIYKVKDALSKHDEFEYSVDIVAMDGNKVIGVTLDNMEQFGELFFIKAVFKSYWITFILTFGDSDFSIRSNFMLKRNEEQVFSYFEMFNAFNINEFRDPDFSFVLNEEMVERVIDRIADFAERYIGIFIETYKNDWTILKTLEDQKSEWILLEILRSKKSKTRRRFSNAFNAFRSGDLKKAAKIYNNLKPLLTSYELMRLEYINEILNGEKEDFTKSSDYIPHNSHKVLKEMSRKSYIELIGFIVGWLPTTAVVSLIFIAVYYSFLRLQREYVFMLISGVEMCFVPALFIGLIAWMIPRKYFLKLILKENFEKYIAVDTFNNSKFYRKILPIINVLVISLSIIFTVFTLNWNIKFDDNKLLDNSKYFSIKPRVIMYSEIEAIYKEEKYRNSFDEIIDSTSYFIVLKNGELLDLRTLMYDKEGFEKIALPYLSKNAGIPLKRIELKEKL